MKKTAISILTAVIMLPFITGFRNVIERSESFCLFPELTFSNAVEFNKKESETEKIEICEETEKVEVKFKVFEWLMSVFKDS